MKKNKILIISLTILLIISIVTIITLVIKLNGNIEKKTSSYDALRFKQEYEKFNGKEANDEKIYSTVEIAENNPIKYVNLEELVNIINTKEKAYIYISSPTCPFCRATVEVLLKVAKELKIDTIYYYNTSEETIEDAEKFNNLKQQLAEKDIIRVDDNGELTWRNPTVVKTSNGITDEIIMGVEYKLDENQSPYDSITEEQEKIMYNAYYEKMK